MYKESSGVYLRVHWEDEVVPLILTGPLPPVDGVKHI